MNDRLSNKKILLTLLGNAVDIFIGFGTVMLVTRTFPEEIAGQWFLFVTVFAILNNLRDGFIQNGLVKFTQGDCNTTKLGVYKTSLLVTLTFELTTCLLVTALFLAFDWFSLSTLFTYYPLYSIPYALYRWAFMIHRSQLRVTNNILMNVGFLIVLIAGATYIYLLQMPLTTLVVVLGLSSSLAAIIGLSSLNMISVLKQPTDKASFDNIVYYGKHGILRELTGTISTRISLFITASLLSYTQTAFLGVAQRYLTLLLIPNSAFQSLLYPILVRVSHSDPTTVKNTYEFQVSKLLAAMLFIAAGITVVSPWLITFIHGEDYQPAVGLLIISVWTLAIFSPFGSAFGSIINTIGKPKINSTIVFVNSCINVTLSFALISSLGLYGAVLAPLITEIFGYHWAGRIVARHTEISYSNILSMIPKHYKSLFVKLKLTLTP